MIISPITTHSPRTSSHRGGWGRMWSKSLQVPMGFKQDYTNENIVFFEHGMEWKANAKGINYFLESQAQVAMGNDVGWKRLTERALLIQNFENCLYSLDIDCPMYGTLLKSRLKSWSPDYFKQLDFDKIDKVCSEAITLRQENLVRNSLTLGDSHALSAWDGEGYIRRIDGLTLNGALKQGLDTLIEPFKGVSRLRVYFGNIDVRHHLCRLYGNQYKEAADVLAYRYLGALKRTGIENVEVVQLLPIEDESRKLPKTGYYKHKPFWGTWQQRSDTAKHFNWVLENTCPEYGYTLLTWPDTFKNEQGQLRFEVMEKPRSVHLSQDFYRWSAQ